MTDDWDISFDIDDLIEPENKKKNVFAKTPQEIMPDKGIGIDRYVYEKLGYEKHMSKPMGEAYQRNTQGYESHIEFMTPEDYLNSVGIMGNIKEYKTNKTDEINIKFDKKTGRERVNEYKQAMISGDKFPMPSIWYREGNFSGQEGIHRAVAAEELGIQKIPVVKIDQDKKKYYNQENWWDIERKMKTKTQNPFTFETELI